MALPTTGAVSYSQIRTEFGQSGAVDISAYKRGAGIVPNHTANASIPTTNSNIAVSNFYGAELAFTCDLTEGQVTDDDGTVRVIQTGFYQGSIGSVSRSGIGIGRGSSQGTFETFYNIQSFFKESLAFTGDFFIISGGDYTGTWWSTIVYRSNTVNRTSADTPNGTFDSGNNLTSWEFAGSNFAFTGSGTHLFTLNLT